MATVVGTPFQLGTITPPSIEPMENLWAKVKLEVLHKDKIFDDAQVERINQMLNSSYDGDNILAESLIDAKMKGRTVTWDDLGILQKAYLKR